MGERVFSRSPIRAECSLIKKKLYYIRIKISIYKKLSAKTLRKA